MLRGATLAWVAVVVGGVGSSALADVPNSANPALKAELTQLLDAAWGRDADALSRAWNHYRAAQAIAAGDSRPRYAMVLALVRLRKYQDAAELAKELVREHPSDSAGWWAKMWLSAMLRQRDAALLEMESLATSLPMESDDRALDDFYRDTANRMGRMLAYFEGPLADSVDAGRLRDVRERILTTLSSPQMESLDRGYQDVQQRYAQLKQEHEATREDVRTTREQQQQMDLNRLAQEQQTLEQDKASLQQQLARAQALSQQALAQLRQEMVPLDQQATTLTTQAAAIRGEMSSLDLEIRRLLDLAAQTEDPAFYSALVADADRLGIQLARRRTDFQRVDAELARVNQQRAALDQQARLVVANYEAEAKRISSQAANVARNEQRIAREQKDAVKPVSSTSPRVRSLSSSLTSLTTYCDYPLERERQRLLDSL